MPLAVAQPLSTTGFHAIFYNGYYVQHNMQLKYPGALYRKLIYAIAQINLKSLQT